MIDHPDGLDYMAFCFAVFGAPSGISGAESRIVSCNHSRADFEVNSSDVSPGNKPRTEG
jgi:hypothetical protein